MRAPQQAIDEALRRSDPRDVTDSVKEIVARTIADVDKSLEVRKTEYFNHSYMPDLVTWWGSYRSDHREVFLRFDSADPHLALDIERLNGDQPMFFSLKSRSVDETTTQLNDALANHPQTMVTAADGIEALSGSTPGSLDALLSTTVVQAGRGFVDESKATKALSDTREGINGALSADKLRTQAAILITQDILEESVSRRFGRYFQLLWLAGGGTIDSFPGKKDLAIDGDQRSERSLIELLLRTTVTESTDYWRRLGSMVTLGLLESLESVDALPNLQRLVCANSTRLLVSYAAVSARQPNLFSNGLKFRWSINDSRLCLDGPTWTIKFADDGRHFRGLTADCHLPTWDEVSRMASLFHLEGVEFHDEVHETRIKPLSLTGSKGHIAIDRLADMYGDQAQVRSVTVRSGQSITVEFDRQVAYVLDSLKTTLPQLTEVAATLMTASDPIEVSELTTLLTASLELGGLWDA